MINILKRLCRTGGNESQHSLWHKSRRGAVLIIVIVTMTVAAGLGAAMLSLTSTSQQDKTTANQGRKGMYLAESGLRYAAGEYRRAGDVTAQDAKLKELHAKTFALDNGNEFDLDIRPYYYQVVGVSEGNLKVSPFGGVPHCFDGGAADAVSGYLKSGTSKYDYTYTGTTVATEGDDTFLYFNVISDSGSIVVNDIVFPVCLIDGDATVSKNGNISLRSGTGAEIFPSENCRFRINNIGTVYRYKRLDLTNDLLKNITLVDDPTGSFTLTLSDGDYVVPERFIKLTSSGSVGTAGAETTRDVAFDLSVEEVAEPVALFGLFGNEWVVVHNSRAIYSYDSSTTPEPEIEDSTGAAAVCSNELVDLRNYSSIDGSVFLGDDGNGNEGEYNAAGNPGPTVTGEAPVDVDRITPDPLGASSGSLATDFSTYSSSSENDNALADPAIEDNVISMQGSGGGNSSSLWWWWGGTAWAAGNSGNGNGNGNGNSGNGNSVDTVTLYGKEGGAHYYLTDITLGNGDTLKIDTSSGPVYIYLTGGLEAKNGSTINVTGNPTDVTIYSNSSENIDFKNSSIVKGAVYAPYANVNIHNSSDFYGMVWAETIDLKNSGNIYYDTALQGTFEQVLGTTLRQ